MYVEAPELATYPNIRHAFFTREGGVSEGIYASLNGGLGSSDDPEKVRENRRRMAAELEVAPEALVSVHQVHSADAVIVEKPWEGQRPKADGMATAVPGIDPAHESHRSAAFAPRLASVNVTLITAPFPSSTSDPHLSQTRTVFLATIYLPEPGAASAIPPR